MIALITDFGTNDLYAGLMKAAIAALAPAIPIIDITHSIPSHDRAAGSFALACAFDYLPKGTVIVAVVDPGVGSNRRRIAVAIDNRVVVCPDNGLLGDLLHTHSVVDAVELDRAEFFANMPSPTFDGRDVFAPVAAQLATGTPLRNLGMPISDAQFVLATNTLVDAARSHKAGAIGHVRHVDKFGNLVTDIQSSLLQKAAGQFTVRIGSTPEREASYVRTYSDVRLDEPCLLTGSSAYVEFARREGRAIDWYSNLTLPEPIVIERAS
ncbi:MAG: SAM-dependent chlorinase/fluorinase [Capsulimonadaceae bacterium]|nr:SAM-dependent chlorinase/fluorinase [Capsulimonadaceae bacterium]